MWTLGEGTELIIRFHARLVRPVEELVERSSPAATVDSIDTALLSSIIALEFHRLKL